VAPFGSGNKRQAVATNVKLMNMLTMANVMNTTSMLRTVSAKNVKLMRPGKS
jgi:hypothetical protein